MSIRSFVATWFRTISTTVFVALAAIVILAFGGISAWGWIAFGLFAAFVAGTSAWIDAEEAKQDESEVR